MADLNELSQFEKDLKALIESRGGFTQPVKEEPIRSARVSGRTEPPKTFMMVWEHGQPYRQPDRPSGYSRMAVREHGQPYALTNMAVREHGQPYCRTSTDMAVRHHGRPYA